MDHYLPVYWLTDNGRISPNSHPGDLESALKVSRHRGYNLVTCPRGSSFQDWLQEKVATSEGGLNELMLTNHVAGLSSFGSLAHPLALTSCWISGFSGTRQQELDPIQSEIFSTRPFTPWISRLNPRDGICFLSMSKRPRKRASAKRSCEQSRATDLPLAATLSKHVRALSTLRTRPDQIPS